jgi:hypothetical protein
MDIRQLTGEISREEIIDIGDNVIVKYLSENNRKKNKEGILTFVSPLEIKINGYTIKVEKILSIKKYEKRNKE